MRQAKVERKTEETYVKVAVNLDKPGEAKLQVGKPFLEHMLNSMAFHGSFTLEIFAEEKGPVYDDHHLVEDLGLVLGQALDKALGDKKGINRFGSAVLPMDDALIMVSLDLSGRPYYHSNLKFRELKLGELSSEMVDHFFRSLAEGGRFNLHIVAIRGLNSHHKAEAAFKALGRALGEAVKLREAEETTPPSLKGVL